MKKFVIAFATLIIFTVGARAFNADKLWTESVSDLREELAKKARGISDIEKYRTVALSKPMSAKRRDLCQAGYDTMIANRKAERAALEIVIAAKSLDASDPARPTLIDKLYQKDMYLWHDAELTGGLWRRLWVICPGR